ncbi:ankyrin repeat protein [Grosmannia clavigera kw1407]|uniref:Ankyrin repeat protein n=1 Tax=Grosmannia clavigera (strain kw1407 / UAMH 11150) TaxID=655863 RepID=F0XEE3_GROCL|nr:ankyrin repeat protein [Grosmannia clavigera kw1407]EFX04600.1 ankyrin repeat protein [Grosmannia clavigera kw1407]
MSVYRVAGLPTTVSGDDAKHILDEFFGLDADTKIRALGLHPQRPSVVAIVMFSATPEFLHGMGPWRLDNAITYGSQLQHIRLEIDTAFLGFTPLNIAGSTEENGIDCFVVSGLSSHPFGSWKERGGQFMWLVDDQDAYPANIRMLLYGYDTSLVASKSFQDISDIGERLAISIKSMRKPERNKSQVRPRPIVFIAHSLGGLIVKEAICHMATNDIFNAKCVYGLVFFGVPHHGLLVEPWLRMVNKQANAALVESLQPGSRILQRLDKHFRRAFSFPGLKVISVYETLQSRTVQERAPGVWDRSGESQVLVNTTSAVGSWPDCVFHTKIPVNQTHEDLPKFKGAFDQDYLLLMDYLGDMWSSAATFVQTRVSTASELDNNTSPHLTDEAIGAMKRAKPPPIGLFTLWPNPDTQDVKKFQTDFDVIAIHGLCGHAFNTWMEGDKLWLRDFLPWEMPKARVLTFGYDTEQVLISPTSNIRGSAEQLLKGIRRLRQKHDEKAGRKAIYVCHGLGGIVLKQALVLAHEGTTLYDGISESVAGIIFLGTPHQGPEKTFWSDYLKKLAHIYKPPRNSVESLEIKSVELGNACLRFGDCMMGLQIFSLYEQNVEESLESLVVDKSSAILHLPNETPLSLNADHRGMCRFLTSSSSNYLTVYNCISELIDAPSSDAGQTYFDRSEREFMSKLGAIDEGKVLDLIPSHWGQSARWFLDDTEFESWTRLRGRQVLWLHGPPGSGKTVLMRTAISHLKVQSDISDSSIIRKPLHFFFDDKDLRRKTTSAFVRSILNQILRDSRTAFLVRYLEGRDGKKDAANEENLWICLEIIIRRSRGIVFQLVVDAVDEVLRSDSDASITVIDRLEHLMALDSSGRLRIMISHRKRPSYEFPNADVAVLDANNNYTQNNVWDYIQAHVRKSLARSYISPDVAETIEHKIMEVSSGNFLHAKLAWEQFSRGVSRWSRELIQDGLLRLDRASHDLVVVYCRLLRAIPSSQRNKAKASFAILRVSRQRLTSRQLAFFATVYSQILDDRPLHLRELELQSADFENYLSESCGYMIRKAEDGTVDFSHVSAKDLLTCSVDELSPEDQETIASYSVSDPDAHSLLQRLCVSVLKLEDRDDKSWDELLDAVAKAEDDMKNMYGYFGTDERIRRMLFYIESFIRSTGRTPCFLYAVQFWVTHYQGTMPSRSNDCLLAKFLPTKTAISCHILWAAIQPESAAAYLGTYQDVHSVRGSTSASLALFQIMTRGDCPGIVKALLADGADINAFGPGRDFITPLSWAIICRRRESFRLLLRDENVSINYGNSQERKALHYAARCSEDVYFTQSLVEHPHVNVNIMGGPLGSPLHQALHSHNIAAVQVFLDHRDIAIDIKNNEGKTPYSMAYENVIWQSILEKMISMASERVLTATTSSGTSPFLTAGSHGWTRIEEAILRAYPKQLLQVDPHTKMNALATYAFFGRREKLLWILERLPPETKLRHEGEEYDLLHLCAHQNWEDVVHWLQTEYGLLSLPQDHTGRTLLHWALEHNWDASRLSLSDYSSAELNAQDHDGLTAVHIAVANRNMAALEMLVASGASYMLRAKNGMSPVHLAAEQGYRAALEFFIEMPEREFGRTNTGAGLLHLLALWFDGMIVSRFVRFKRARLDVVDKQRRTALHYAAMVNNSAAAERLVALGKGRGGSQLESRDSSGMTPLLEAIRSGAIETAEQLLQLGANARAADAFGQTCLHLSFRYGHGGLVARFLAMKLDIHGIDRFGMTPLHRACSTGRVEHIRDLRRRGARWNPKNIYGRSPIDLAVEFGNVDAVAAMVRWLQNRGASLDQTQHRLRNALKLACELEFKNMEDLLVRAGAEIDRRKIKVKRLYMSGPTPEPGRWALVIPQM